MVIICKIILNNNTIYAGGSLSGNVKYHLDSEETFQGTKLIVCGKAHTSYRAGKSTTHVKEKFLNENIEIFSGQTLQEGTHVYPFTFILPLTCPSSFTNYDSWNSARSSIKYTIKIKRPGTLWSHTDDKQEFFVVKYMDLNFVPQAKDIAEVSVSKETFWLCCSNRPFFVNLHLSRQGFTPGESIPFSLECNNQSTYSANDILVSLRLIEIYYRLSSKNPQERKLLNLRRAQITLSEISLGSVKTRERQTWARKLEIPKIQPLHTDGCKLYDIKYIVYVKVKFPCPHRKLKGEIPIILGNVPITNQLLKDHTISNQNGSHEATNEISQLINNLQDMKKYKIQQTVY